MSLSSPTAAVLGLVWTLLAVGSFTKALRLSLIDLLLALAPLVVVPLGIDLIQPETSAAKRWFRLTRRFVWVGALSAAASLTLSRGPAAGGLAACWLVAAGAAALAWLLELVQSRSLKPSIVFPAGGAAYLAFGAGWLVLSRLGLRPLGFDDVIVELTAVHFHYGGFAAPVIAACAHRFLERRSVPASRAVHAGGLGVLAGMTVVAVGFTFSAYLQTAGAAVLAASLTVLSLVTILSVIPLLRGTLVRLLLAVSAASVVAAMALGLQYALGQVVGIPALPIPQMTAIHGVMNAFGFAVCGLLGWTLVLHSARDR